MATERAGAATFQGNGLTLVGDEVKVGDAAPDFSVLGDDLSAVTLADYAGKVKVICLVPSLDTPVCAVQTRRFNEELSALGDRVNALTVSCDLPFAMARFCGSEGIANRRTGSDYQDRRFGEDWGLTIEELKILTRAVFVLDGDGKIVYAQVVPEVTDEPDYDAALAALRELSA